MKRTELKRKTALRAAGAKKAAAARAARPANVRKRLKQGRSTGKAAASQIARWDSMLLVGCLCCWLNRRLGYATASFARRRPELEIHHLTDCGRRIGHDATLCLCRYHHQGDLLPYVSAGYKVQAERFGPSYGREKRRFRALYGSDADLLQLQDQLVVEANACKP